MPQAKKNVGKASKPAISTQATKSFVKIQEVRLELERRGRGRPLLLLQGEETHEAELPLVDELAAEYEVLMPWPPGFGRSSRPPSIQNMDDISYLYLELLDRLDLKRVAVLGFSMGGWIAAEMATKSCQRLSKMVLVDPYGIKLGGPAARDIADIYTLPLAEVRKRKFHDPANEPRDHAALSDREAERIARHRESTARFCWEPYMHNPKLRLRLGRISVPTLVLWGASDRIVTPSYGRAYAKAIPGARFRLIPRAGHLPHVEQPAAVLREVRRFLARDGGRKPRPKSIRDAGAAKRV